MTGTSLGLGLEAGKWTPFGVSEDGKVYGNENTTVVEINLYNNETKLYTKVDADEGTNKFCSPMEKIDYV